MSKKYLKPSKDRFKDLRPSRISIFNRVDIRVEPRSSQTQSADQSSKQDGCISCFQALVKCFRR